MDGKGGVEKFTDVVDGMVFPEAVNNVDGSAAEIGEVQKSLKEVVLGKSLHEIAAEEQAAAEKIVQIQLMLLKILYKWDGSFVLSVVVPEKPESKGIGFIQVFADQRGADQGIVFKGEIPVCRIPPCLPRLHHPKACVSVSLGEHGMFYAVLEALQLECRY